MSDFIYMTKDRLQTIIKELKYLKKEGRIKIAKNISEARDKGDLSENSEYHAAKEAQTHHEFKINRLEKLLMNAKLIDINKISCSKVNIMTNVTLVNIKTNKCVTYQLVSEHESDIKNNKISIQSPIGKTICNKHINDIVNIKTPGGIITFKILKIFIDNKK